MVRFLAISNASGLQVLLSIIEDRISLLISLLKSEKISARVTTKTFYRFATDAYAFLAFATERLDSLKYSPVPLPFINAP